MRRSKLHNAAHSKKKKGGGGRGIKQGSKSVTITSSKKANDAGRSGGTYAGNKGVTPQRI